MKRGRGAGSPGEPRATAPRHSAGSARRSAPDSRRTPRSRARRLAQVRPVEHRRPAAGNPDASRSWWCRRPTRPRGRPGRARGGAGASGASARHALFGRHGYAGNAWQPRIARHGVQHASRHGHSSAGRDRSGCTAAPARGNANTRTGGRDVRPGVKLLGKTPEDAGTRHARPCAALRWTMSSGNATLASHPLHWRGVGYGVRLLKLPGQWAAAVPAYHSGQVGGSTAPEGTIGCPSTITRPASRPTGDNAPLPCPHDRRRPVGRPAGRPTGRNSCARKKRSAHQRKKRHLTAASQEPTPRRRSTKTRSHRRISAVPDRRSHLLMANRAEAQHLAGDAAAATASLAAASAIATDVGAGPSSEISVALARVSTLMASART